MRERSRERRRGRKGYRCVYTVIICVKHICKREKIMPHIVECIGGG
jgi:hypothetical protein